MVKNEKQIISAQKPPEINVQPEIVTASDLISEETISGGSEQTISKTASTQEINAAALVENAPANPSLPPSATTTNSTANTAQTAKRGRGRPPGSKKKQPEISAAESPNNSKADFSDIVDDTTPESPLTAQQAATDYVALSNVTFDTAVAVLTMAFGPEWQPSSPEEKNAVVVCLENYYRTKQVKDIPPGVLLAVVCLSYAAPRVKHPNTAGKLKNAWLWFKIKILRRKLTTT